jgi:uncharacterized RDD family membrane protein YckC
MMGSRPKPRPEADGLPAGFITRLVAMAIDLALLSVVITSVTVVGQFVGQSLGAGVWSLRLIALASAGFGVGLYIAYFVGLTVLGGQTLGKRIMGVRVLRTDGSRVRIKRSVIRYLGSWLSLPLFWGYLLVLIDNRRQAFHDRLADTIVIYYTIPQDELGPFEQYLRALRIRREARLAAEKAALAAQTASRAPSPVTGVAPADAPPVAAAPVAAIKTPTE